MIAEELEEEQNIVKKIAQTAENLGYYDIEKIYEILKTKQNPA